jgi:hypothetical protein
MPNLCQMHRREGGAPMTKGIISQKIVAIGLMGLGIGGLLVSASKLVEGFWASNLSHVVHIGPVVQRIAVVAHTDASSDPAPANSLDQQLGLVRDLGSDDPDTQQNAILALRAMAQTDPKSLATGLPQWVTPLLHAKAYQDLKQFAQSTILERPFDPVTVRAAQRALVVTCIAKGDYAHALIHAKGYYNIASLEQTGDAVDLLIQVLQRINGPLDAQRFEAEQRHGTGPSRFLDSIPFDSSAYENAIQTLLSHQNGHGEYSHNTLMAQGNLLLLSDRLEEAKQCFEAACRTEQSANKNLRQAVEGVATVIRAQSGNVSGANAFIQSMREQPDAAGELIADGGVPPWEELRITAQHIALSDLTASVVPVLEQQRAQEEQEDVDSSSGVPQVDMGFEGATPVTVAILSPTHIVVEITTIGFRDWFLFRVHNVAGKTIRIDVTGAYKTVSDWAQKAWSLNPLFSAVRSLDDPSAFVSSLPGSETTASNGSVLPDSKGQRWQYISNVWSDKYTLSFVQHFETDTAYVAMRVPRSPGYNEFFMRQLASNPLATVAEIGQSRNHRPLLLARIGDLSANKPCVLLYAQEHADEQDAGWAAQGAIEYLVSNAPDAAQLREHFVFVVIPMLDPDATAIGVHQSIISSFWPGRTTPESIAYANWFQNWVNEGNRLDLVIDLHNIQSGEGPHVFCPLMEGGGIRGDLSMSLHRQLLKNMQAAGYGVQADPQMRGWMPTRLSGWLRHYYGPLDIAYEINSQAPERHLTLAEIKNLGQVFVISAAQFLASQDGHSTLAEVDSRRAERAAMLAGSVATVSHNDAISSEAELIHVTQPRELGDLQQNTVP